MSALSLFSNDPDKAHDKKVSGLAIDPSVTAAKASLRQLRGACGQQLTESDDLDLGAVGTAQQRCKMASPRGDGVLAAQLLMIE